MPNIWARSEDIVIPEDQKKEDGAVGRVREIAKRIDKPESVNPVLDTLATLDPFFTDRMVGYTQIGTLLLKDQPVKVVTLVRPDIGFDNDRTPFFGRGLPADISAQTPFLNSVCARLGKNTKITFLINDLLASDTAIQNLYQVNREELQARVNQSMELIRDQLPRGWETNTFSSFTNFSPQTERDYVRAISADSLLVEQASQLTQQLKSLYRRLWPTINSEEALQRTLRTMAQHRILVYAASTHNSVIAMTGQNRDFYPSSSTVTYLRKR